MSCPRWHALKCGTRSIMVLSMRDNVVSDVVDDNVVSKAKDLGDNGGMTCAREVSGGGVEYTGWYESMKGWYGMLLWYGSL